MTFLSLVCGPRPDSRAPSEAQMPGNGGGDGGTEFLGPPFGGILEEFRMGLHEARVEAAAAELLRSQEFTIIRNSRTHPIDADVTQGAGRPIEQLRPGQGPD